MDSGFNVAGGVTTEVEGVAFGGRADGEGHAAYG